MINRLRFICLALAGASLAPAFGQAPPSSSMKDRINTVRELGKQDSRSIAALQKYLSDPDTEVRVEAVKSIVRVGSQVSLDPLVEATKDRDAKVQQLATDGLVNFYLPGYVAQGRLTGSVTKASRRVKGLVSSRNDQAIEPWIDIPSNVSEALGNVVKNGADSETKANGARAAGILRAKKAVPALSEATKSRDTTLIFESLVAMQKINDRSAGPGIAFLAQDSDEKVQLTALETLKQLNTKEAAPQIRLALNRPRNTKVKRAALATLGQLGLAEDREVFQKYAKDEDLQLRVPALAALGRVREPDDIPMLTSAFNDVNSGAEVHLASAFGLVNQGNVDKSSASPLEYLLHNLTIKNRAAESEAYMEELLRKKEVRSVVQPITPKAQRDARLYLAQAFGHSYSDDALPTLETLQRDVDPDVAKEAVRSIKLIKAHIP